MRQGYKSLLSAVLAVVMIFAACVPAFAAADTTARANKNEGITIQITKRANAFYQVGDIVDAAATVTNNSAEARDIEVKVCATSFAPIVAINDKTDLDHKVVFKDVKPGDSRTVTVKALAKRVELSGGLEHLYSFTLGKLTVMLCEVYDTFAANTVLTSFGYRATMASVIFIANDVTPEPQTEAPVVDPAA